MTRIHSQPVLPKARIPRDVLTYCGRYGILPQLNASISLAFEIYKPVKKIAARIQVDRDADEERVIVDVMVSGTIDEVLARHTRYTKRWFELMPPDAQDRIIVLYHVA